MKQTSDNGFILAGHTTTPDSSGDFSQPSLGGFDYWVIKTDSIGIKLWDKRFGGSSDEELNNISITSDKGYLISGTSYSPISGDKTENNLGIEQTWIVKTDSLGTIQWDKTIFTVGHDEQGLSIQTNDGSFVFANNTEADSGGYKTQHTRGFEDFWFIKFCDTTFTESTTELSIVNSPFSIYPNPSLGAFKIISPQLISSQIEIFNLLGEKIYSAILNEPEKEIELQHTAAGIYFVKVSDGERVFTQKLVVE